MVGEQRHHIAALAKNVLGEALQSLLRPNFDEYPHASVIQRAQAFHELHWSRDLLRKEVEHLGHDIRAGGIELAIYIGHDRQARRFQVQALQFPAQRLAGWGHNRSVEGVADRQLRDVVAGFLKNLHGLRNRIAGAANDCLMFAVDIGDHHVALDRLQNSFDFIQRCKHSGHLALVGHGHARHAATAGADCFQGFVERQSAGSDQCPVLAQAVTHCHVGLDSVCGQQPGEG